MLAVTAAVISNCHGNGAGRWGGLRARRRHFLLGFLFVNCRVAYSEFNLSSHGHSEKLTRFAW